MEDGGFERGKSKAVTGSPSGAGVEGKLKLTFEGGGMTTGDVEEEVVSIKGKVKGRGDDGGDVIDGKGEEDATKDATLRDTLLQYEIPGEGTIIPDPHCTIGQEGLNEEREGTAKIKRMQLKKDACSPGGIVSMLEV